MFILGDFLSRLNVGSNLKKRYVKVFRNSLTLNLLNLLYKQGFINGYFISHKEPFYVFVVLKYVSSKPIIKNFIICSKPSKKIYVSYKDIIKNYYKKGFFVFSTSKFGVILLNDDFLYNASISPCGGKLLFKIII